MAAKKKKSPSRPIGLLSCFGLALKAPSSDEKVPKSGGRKKVFSKLCLPKARIMKKKPSLDAKDEGNKRSQSIEFEVSKVEDVKVYDDNNQTPNIQPHKAQQNQPKDATTPKQDCTSEPEPELRPRLISGSIFGMTKATKDSLIGFSIIMTTFMIMSIWGRLYAILCMSAWFYCLSLFGITATNQEITKKEPTVTSSDIQHKSSKQSKDVQLNLSSVVNINSETYKKEIILGGLLQRDHKLSIVKSFS